MNGRIVNTDRDWFNFLRGQPGLEEVNFWRPRDTRTPRQLKPGMPVLFKLRKEYGGWIVGWGTFSRYEVLPVWLAWDAFEQRNGAASYGAMRERIQHLRHDSEPGAVSSGDYAIGCLMLARPLVFFREDAFVRPPADWAENIVSGKGYDLSLGEGARVWRDCQARAGTAGLVVEPRPAAGERYGKPILVAPRLGQGTFQIAVTAAYGRACAVTGEHSLPALEAAHIRPYAEDGPHEIANGLLLRSDIHRLFDRGYVAVTPEHRFVVSRRLKDDFENGHSYYPLNGRAIRLPERPADRPDRAWIEWHLQERWRS